MTKLEIYIMSRLGSLEWYIQQELEPTDTRVRAHELKILCEYSGVSESVLNRAKMVYNKAVELDCK